MSNFLRSPIIKFICWYLVLVMIGLLPVPKEARASFISNQPQEITEMDQESLEALRTVLEQELIAEKLSKLGLTGEEVIQRVEQLSPEERELVLEKLDTIQSGGFIEDLPVGFRIAVLVFIGVFVLIIHILIPSKRPQSNDDTQTTPPDFDSQQEN